MTTESAGLLLYRIEHGKAEVLLVHPGGPLWINRDKGAWSIPKGLISQNEEPLQAAQREFEEETGFRVSGQFFPLEPLTQRKGKIVYAWAVRGDIDTAAVNSNTFSLEWPPKSGSIQKFPEVDRAAWLGIEVARQKIVQGQAAFLDQLEKILELSSSVSPDPRNEIPGG